MCRAAKTLRGAFSASAVLPSGNRGVGSVTIGRSIVSRQPAILRTESHLGARSRFFRSPIRVTDGSAARDVQSIDLMRALIDDVVQRTGLERHAAVLAVWGTIEVLASGLDQEGRDGLLAILPDDVAAGMPLVNCPANAKELHARVGRALAVRPAEATEIARTICREIHARLAEEMRARLARLQPELVEIVCGASTVAPTAEPTRNLRPRRPAGQSREPDRKRQT